MGYLLVSSICSAVQLQSGYVIEDMPTAATAEGCFLDGQTSYVGGNLFGKRDVNRTETLSACCSLCQQTRRA